GQRGDAAFERRDPLFEDRLCRVHDPGVDVAQLREAEERRGMSCIPEGIAGGLIDGNRPGTRRWVRYRASVNLAGFKAPVSHGVVSFVGPSSVQTASGRSNLHNPDQVSQPSLFFGRLGWFIPALSSHGIGDPRTPSVSPRALASRLVERRGGLHRSLTVK